MSLSLDGTASARLVAAVRGAHWLVDLDFTTGTIRYTTSPVSIVYAGITYLGFGNLAEVSGVGESEDPNASRVTLGFTAVNSAMIAAGLGNVEAYRGRAVRLYLQLLDETFQPAGAPRQRWAGRMEPVRITRKRAGVAGGSGSGRIEIPCSRAGMARARNALGLRLSDSQQQLAYAGDKGYEYIQTLIEKPTLWLSKRFQEI